MSGVPAPLTRLQKWLAYGSLVFVMAWVAWFLFYFAALYAYP